MSSWPWILLGIFAALLISGSHALAIISLRRLSLSAFLGLRALAGLACSLPWLPRLADLSLDARGWVLFAASLFLSPFLIGVLYFRGLVRGSLSAQGGLRQTSPGMVMLWQWSVLGATASSRDWLGLALAVGGTALLVAGQPRQARATVGFGLAAAATQAAALLVQAALLPRIDPFALIAAQNAGFALLTIAWLAHTRLASPAPPSAPGADAPSLRLAITLALASGLIIQVLFDRIKFTLLSELGAFPTACLLLLQLPFFALLARVCFHERINRRQAASLALIFCGALVGAR